MVTYGRDLGGIAVFEQSSGSGDAAGSASDSGGEGDQAGLRLPTVSIGGVNAQELATPLVATTGWGYLRLRRQDYGEQDLRAWAEKLRAQSWDEAYVFFKHEEGGRGPALAGELTQILASE